MEFTGLMYGLLAMLGWGAGDFCARLAVDKVGPYRSVVVTQLAGAIPLLLIASWPLAFDWWLVALLLALGAMWAVSIAAFYKGMEVGKLSIVSPLASCWAMVAVLLSVVFFGEALSLQQIGAIGVVFAGIILCSTKLSELAHIRRGTLVKGAKYGLVAMLMWGVVLTAVKLAFPAFGEITPIILIKLAAAGMMLAYAPIGKISWKANWAGAWKPLVGIAVFDSVAFAAYNYGISGGMVSLVAPVSSAFPALTLLLAFVFLRERLERAQWAGVALILAGLVLLSL